ncbi:MAG TPA: sialidase family protein [Rhizomicrobium sp.]|nr:sialidase family protein [Rhizomicrobium sp.]
MKFKSILMAGIPAVAALCLSASAQAGSDMRPVQLPKSPISPSTLIARGLHAGTIHLSAAWNRQGKINPPLHCTPAPCALPNVEGSAGATEPVDETPIAVNPRNQMQLITGGNDYNCSNNLRAFWTSNDRGKTWSGACAVDVTGQSGDGDPVVGYDLKGNVYQGGIDSGGVSIASSSNNGKTWNNAVTSSAVSGDFADKPWLAIDTNANSPNKNDLYVSNTMFDGNSDSTIYVSHSSDGGQHWTIVQASPTAIYPTDVNQFSDLTIGADGTVYLTYMNCPATGTCTGQKSTMYIQKSTDGGNTWSSQVVIDTPTLAPGSCGFYGCLPNTAERVSDIPVIGIDNSGGARNGQLYVVDYNWTGSFMQVRVLSSTDGGSTWSAPVNVAPKSAKHDQFFPWLNVDNKGNVGVTWLDRRNDPNNLDYEAYATWSTDGGNSFRTNVQIADTPSNPDNDGFEGGFMGDYSGNAWYNGKLYASWTDTRNGSYSQDEIGGLRR